MKLSGPGLIALSLAFLLPGSPVVASPPEGGYHLLKKIPFGAAAGGGSILTTLRSMLLRAVFTFPTAPKSR